MWFTDKRDGVESVIYKEYLKLSKIMNLVVLAKHSNDKIYDNIKVVKIPKTK